MRRYRYHVVALVVLTAVCVACQPVSGVPPGEPPVPTSSPTVAPAPAETLTATPFPAPVTPVPTVPSTSPTAAMTPSPPAATSTPFQSLEQPGVVAQAVDDLARRLGVAPAEVEVVAVTTDEFPLQNLGCPTGPSKEEPVLPAFVVGQIIHLRVGDDVYEYRAHGRRVVFCRRQELDS